MDRLEKTVRKNINVERYHTTQPTAVCINEIKHGIIMRLAAGLLSVFH